MRHRAVNFLLAMLHCRIFVAGTLGLFLAALLGWIPWATAALAIGAMLAGFSIGRNAASGAGFGPDTRALFRALDRNLEQIADETSRATILTQGATKEIGQCFEQWEAAIDGSDPAATEAARTASCDVIRLLQFEDISSQALNIGLEGIAVCRNTVQSLEREDISSAEGKRRLENWQKRRRNDAQRDLGAGTVELFE